MGLYVGVVSAEELAGAVPGDVLHHVHALAAAVVALAGIALGVLVGEHGTGGGHHGLADKVLGGDKLDILALAVVLRLHGLADLRVLRGNKVQHLLYHFDWSLHLIKVKEYSLVQFSRTEIIITNSGGKYNRKK